MTESGNDEGTTFRFEDTDIGVVQVTIISGNGSAPFDVTLKNVTWGMLEDIMAVQEKAKDDMKVVFDFFNDYVEGGGRAVPLMYTMQFFEAISEYMNQVMVTQKN